MNQGSDAMATVGAHSTLAESANGTFLTIRFGRVLDPSDRFVLPFLTQNGPPTQTGRLQHPIEGTLENCVGIRLEAAPVAENDALRFPREHPLDRGP